MADHTLIEWTDATWNPITGCSIVSPGCIGCYAMKLAGTRLKHTPSRAGLTTDSKAGPVWNGQVRLNMQWLDQPLRWRRPRRIFVCAHGDLFAENVPDEWIDQVFAVMALAPEHTFQVLTKRPKRMRQYLDEMGEHYAGLREGYMDRWGGPASDISGSPCAAGAVEDCGRPLPNVWLGVSAERQQEADERIPELLATPAVIRFISAEPLLGPLNIEWALSRNRIAICAGMQRRGHFSPGLETMRPLDWIIVGGESGPSARPLHPAWARSIRDQCAAAGVPFFFKQWGEWAPTIGAVDGWAIDDNPEISRFEHREWEDDGWSEPFWPMWCDWSDGNYDEEQCVSRIGKKRAGRMLDGVEHSAMPATGEVPAL